jgi:hypothetical protein
LHGRTALWNLSRIAFLFAALGCSNAAPPADCSADPPSDRGALFDPTTAGLVTGHVRWTGRLPEVPPLVVRPNMFDPRFGLEKSIRPNPNAPAIDTATRGVKDAVIFLRGAEPRRARPWDHAPVRVVQQGQQFHVRQGDGDAAVGFVRRGDAVEMVSADAVFHSLHADGAAYFTLAFADADQPRTRRLPNRGLVELTSGAGYFWMRGYLFVDEHPYYALTDAQGRFELKDVPPGRYDVVCWRPDWREDRHERDPESNLISRLFFRPPLEMVRSVAVAPKGTSAVTFEVSAP